MKIVHHFSDVVCWDSPTYSFTSRYTFKSNYRQGILCLVTVSFKNEVVQNNTRLNNSQSQNQVYSFVENSLFIAQSCKWALYKSSSSREAVVKNSLKLSTDVLQTVVEGVCAARKLHQQRKNYDTLGLIVPGRHFSFGSASTFFSSDFHKELTWNMVEPVTFTVTVDINVNKPIWWVSYSRHHYRRISLVVVIHWITRMDDANVNSSNAMR